MKSLFTNKKRLSALLLGMTLIISALSLSSCSNNSEVPDGYQYATCTGAFYRLYVPTQWTASTEFGVSGAYLSSDSKVSVTMEEIPIDGGQTAGIDGETVTADSSAPDAVTDLNSFVASHLSRLKTRPDFVLIKESDTNISSKKAKSLEFSSTVSGITYRFKQILCKVDGRYYIFTYASPADTYGNYTEMVDEIVSNIRFYNSPFTADEANKVKDKGDVPDGMKPVSTEKASFRFYIPNDWETDPSSSVYLSWVTEEDGTRSNVTVMPYYPANQSMTVDAYWELCSESYTASLDGYTLISAKDTKMGDMKAKEYVYSYSVGGVAYTTSQTVCVFSTMLYSLNYTACSEHFDAHLDAVDMMRAAIRFRGAFD